MDKSLETPDLNCQCLTCKPCMQAEVVNENETRIPMQKNTMPLSARDDCNACVLEMVGLAQAYVPFQTDLDRLSDSESLLNGTTFANLVQPFVKGTGLGKKMYQ